MIERPSRVRASLARSCRQITQSARKPFVVLFILAVLFVQTPGTTAELILGPEDSPQRSVAPQSALDWPIPSGHFFTQTAAGAVGGYSVKDDAQARFYSEFTRLGGVAVLGYPISSRFEWDGFTVQAFQRSILQWRPELNAAYYVNVFDRLNELGADDYLIAYRQTPRPKAWNDAGLTWEGSAKIRMDSLASHPAIQRAYSRVGGDPLAARGLPTSDIEDMGNHYAVRLQRAVLQEWKEDVPWAKKGEVTTALGGDILKELILSGALSVVSRQPFTPEPMPAIPPPPGVRGEGRTVLGYYVPYDSSSWWALNAQADKLDYVAAQWVWPNACGDLTSSDDLDLISYARSKGVGVMPSLLTSSEWLNHQLLTTPATSDRFIQSIVSYVDEMGYDGFDLDLESVEAGDRQALSQLVDRLAQALHARGKLLTIAIPAKTSEVRTGWAGAYDYAALGRSADLVLIMSYSFTYSTSAPGSTAPSSWVERVAAYTASQIAPEKVLLGIAFYGYDWNETRGGSARALRAPQAQNLARYYGAPVTLDPKTQSATFTYSQRPGDQPTLGPAPEPIKHNVVTREPKERCDVKPPTGPPQPTATPRPTPTPAPIERHVVWFEDRASVMAKLDIASRYNLAGIGAWRLGQEEEALWPELARWREGR